MYTLVHFFKREEREHAHFVLVNGTGHRYSIMHTNKQGTAHTQSLSDTVRAPTRTTFSTISDARID